MLVAAWLAVLEIENSTIGLRHGWEALGAMLVAAMTLAARFGAGVRRLPLSC